MALAQLVSSDLSVAHVHLFKDATESLWDKPPTKYTNSVQEYIGFDFDNDTVTISRNGDLMGDCFLHVTGMPVMPGMPGMPGIQDLEYESIYDLITSISYEIGGQMIEKYTGQALRMLATFDKKAKASIQGNKVVFPLRLCTSETKLPLISLRFHEVKVKVVLASSDTKLQKKLFVNYICLDTEERRTIAQNPHQYQVFQKSVMSHTFKSNTQNQTCDINVTNFLKGAVRDVIVLIKQIDKCLECHEPLIDMRIIYKKHVLQMDLDGIMLRHVIPRQTYGIENIETNTEQIYFMPFDNTPTTNTCTGFFNFREGEKTTLKIQLEPGSYQIYIMARTFNLLKTESGMAGMVWT